ncbi:hypothetical protein ACOYW6_03655 [Parablastomonas sp. CN1-191]|uniref:hypothetical protein n=1 Tax=Parablastomonas sp. CN1-191 TaxID=3400908 RepID=UPI003BF8BA99
MAEERYTTVETPSGDTHTHTTVVDDGGRSGGGAGWLIAIVLILALVAGIYFVTQSNASQANKDNAVAAAAKDVGNAAQNVGDAAQNAADNVKKN